MNYYLTRTKCTLKQIAGDELILETVAAIILFLVTFTILVVPVMLLSYMFNVPTKDVCDIWYGVFFGSIIFSWLTIALKRYIQKIWKDCE